jgi:hypothetical protein
VLYRREPARDRPTQLRLVLRGRLRMWPLSGNGDWEADLLHEAADCAVMVEVVSLVENPWPGLERHFI